MDEEPWEAFDATVQPSDAPFWTGRRLSIRVEATEHSVLMWCVECEGRWLIDWWELDGRIHRHLHAHGICDRQPPIILVPRPCCSVPGCDTSAIGDHGLCRRHYLAQRFQETNAVRRAQRLADAPPPPTCSAEGCDLQAGRKSGMCNRHWQASRRLRLGITPRYGTAQD